MGLRGPLRNPNSRRGQAEIRKRQRLAEQQAGQPQSSATETCIPENGNPELPTYPKCFTRQQAELFQNLVTDLLAARVPLARVDSHAIAMAVRCISAIEDADRISADPEATVEQRLAALRLQSTFSKDLKEWLTQICANPGARVRIGVKGTPEKKAGPLAAILAAKQRRNG